MSAAPALEERGVKSLVDAWLAAQNDGDFAAYERLYAPRFTGVKRAGQRETTYDREGWLADRKSMFTRPMRVDAGKIELSVTPGGASAELEQTWSSATYRDVGVKRLVIVPTPAGARIAREEMVSSEVAGEEARPTSLDVVAMHRDGLVLSASPDETWATGPYRADSARRVVQRDVDETKLPALVSAWKGRAVRTFSHDGGTCDAKVSGFALRAEVVPHFGMENHWRGMDGEPAASVQQVAEDVWKMAENGGRVLIGKLEPGCAGSAWALPADKRLPSVAKPVNATPELRAAALRAFRALPTHQAIQREFLREKAASGSWDLSEPDALKLSVFESSSKPVLVSVSAKAGTGCGDFYGELSAVFEPKGRAGLELQLLDEPSALEPIAAFDLHGDGSFQILFAPEPASDERSLWRRHAKGASLTELFTIPYLDCPC